MKPFAQTWETRIKSASAAAVFCRNLSRNPSQAAATGVRRKLPNLTEDFLQTEIRVPTSRMTEPRKLYKWQYLGLVKALKLTSCTPLWHKAELSH